jgi:hypothetical protein
MPELPPRRRLARGAVVAVVVALVVPVAVSGVTYSPPELQSGTIERPADNETVVGVQGFKLAGQDSGKKPARVVGISGDGNFSWQVRDEVAGARWYYDVDPLPGDDLLLTSVNPGETVVIRLDRTTREVQWVERLPYEDTHDVDWLGDGKLLIANMRNYNETTGENDDRMVVYDREAGEEVWEWEFAENGYDRSGGGDYTDDWTHVNDVEEVGDGLYMASVRNFDQVVVVNRSTGDIEARLGEDGNHSTLYEQHNPDLIRSEDGTPTVIVADSENDRVVEYARDCEGPNDLVRGDPEDCTWELTWELSGGMNWPRDADRLPNGNTLVTDSLNHRVMEVTPEGRIVWEYYATWGPYEAERIGTGDESSGPTIADMNATGTATLSNSAGITPGTGSSATFADSVTRTFAGTPLSGGAAEFANRYQKVTPWVRPYWMSGWDFALAALAALLLVGWGLVEAVLARDRIRARAGDVRERLAS